MPIEEWWVGEEMMLAVSNLQKLELAIDVGANTGSWTSEISKAFRKVIAIEPDERASDFIARTQGVEVISAAVSDESGEAELFLREEPSQNSLLPVHPIGGAGAVHCPCTSAIRVKTVTLDEICPDGADFVKIDVEGAEEMVLRGCRDVSKWLRTAFVVECHGTMNEVENQLLRLRKRVAWIEHPYEDAHPGHCWAVARCQ